MTYQPHHCEDVSLKPVAIEVREVLEPLRLNGVKAAKMMGCSRSTFFQRVKDGVYPKPGRDGLWSVSLLREASQRMDAPT